MNTAKSKKHSSTPMHEDLKVKPQFWRECVFAKTAVKLPTGAARRYKRETTWTIRDVIGELRREPRHCTHIDGVQPPRPIWGLDIDQLLTFEQSLYDAAARIRKPRFRNGREESMRQPSSTPTLMSCVATWPTPGDPPEGERVRWEQLVIDAARDRFGDQLVAVVAHTDEGRYHLHLLVHDFGRNVKPLCIGHAMAEEWYRRSESEHADAGEAYRAGASAAQDWYHRTVAQHMGWARNAPAPRPRVSRAKALQLKEQALADADAALRARFLAHAKEMRTQETRLRALEEQLAVREAKLLSDLEVLVEERTRLEVDKAIDAEVRNRQREFDDEMARVRADSPKPKPSWARILRR